MRKLIASYREMLVSRTTGVLLLSTALIVLYHYHFRSKYFRRYFGDLTFSGPYFDLYPHLYWFLTTFILFLLVPLVVIRLIHKERPLSFGLGLGNWKMGLKAAGILILVMIPITYLASRTPVFLHKYPLNKAAADGLDFLLIYQAGMLMYFIGWEFFFRGYMLFSLESSLGKLAVVVQTIPFVLLHFGKPEAEVFSSIIAGLALGILALETRSCWYGILIHWIVALSLDVFVIYCR